MFLVKSAFWLTVAFITIHPGGSADLGKTASALTGQAVADGQRIAVAQLIEHACVAPLCLALQGSATRTVAPASPSTTPHVEARVLPTPVPIPRPAWMG